MVVVKGQTLVRRSGCESDSTTFRRFDLSYVISSSKPLCPELLRGDGHLTVHGCYEDPVNSRI